MSIEASSAGRAVYTVPEVAAILGLSERLAYEMVRTGQIPSLRLGRRKVVVPKRVIEEMLAPTDARIGAGDGRPQLNGGSSE